MTTKIMRTTKIMTNKSFYVYCHTNNINGKKYIGITCQKPKDRWRNGKGYKNGFFANAIKKYGWDNFTHEVLFSGISEEDAKKLEIELIAKYNTMDRKYGYNLTKGGNLTTGYHHTEKAKAKMSFAKHGMYDGKNNPMYGKSGELAPAYGLKRSEKFRKERQAPVVVIDTNNNVSFICESIIEASQKTGCDRRTISRVCRGVRKSSHGFRFEYKDKSRLSKVRKDKK